MKMTGLRAARQWGAFIAIGALSACSTVDMGAPPPSFAKGDGIALLPIANYTETPDAGQRVASITQSILYQQGVTQLHWDTDNAPSTHLAPGLVSMSDSDALEWARSTGAHYALKGAVQEWRYKVGVDGEPTASVTYHLIDLDSGEMVWSATGSRSGWSRSSVAGVGQSLIRQLLTPLTPPR